MKITIVTAVWNGVKTLATALESVRGQALTEGLELEHVVVDGGSTGGFRSNVQINREDLRALRANGYWSCLPLIYTKYLFKIWGFVFRKRQAR